MDFTEERIRKVLCTNGTPCMMDKTKAEKMLETILISSGIDSNKTKNIKKVTEKVNLMKNRNI